MAHAQYSSACPLNLEGHATCGTRGICLPQLSGRRVPFVKQLRKYAFSVRRNVRLREPGVVRAQKQDFKGRNDPFTSASNRLRSLLDNTRCEGLSTPDGYYGELIFRCKRSLLSYVHYEGPVRDMKVAGCLTGLPPDNV